MTYTQIGERCTLSRALIARGLKKLAQLGLIRDEGTTRKKRYVLEGNPRSGWCKLPCRDVIKQDGEISAFSGFNHRHPYERDALKIFMCLLSIRSNTKRFVDVSRGSLSIKTGTEVHRIDGAVGFLRGVGLLERVESKGYLKNVNFIHSNESQKLHRYWVVGCKTLNLRSVLVESESNF